MQQDVLSMQYLTPVACRIAAYLPPMANGDIVVSLCDID